MSVDSTITKSDSSPGGVGICVDNEDEDDSDNADEFENHLQAPKSKQKKINKRTNEQTNKQQAPERHPQAGLHERPLSFGRSPEFRKDELEREK